MRPNTRGRRNLPLWLLAVLAVVSLLVPSSAAANSPVDPAFDWVRPDGTEDVSAAPDFVYLADEAGQKVLCADGSPARVPYNWDELEIPVVSLVEKAVSGELRRGHDSDGGEWLELTEAEAFHPDPQVLCSRY